MIWFLIFILSCYTILILALAIGFKKIDAFKAENVLSSTNFSVIIPFRNESKYLTTLLNSILALDYDKEMIEFIFVDDASSDDSVKIIETFIETFQVKNFYILENKRTSNSPKKDAIATAISNANNNWIITTDADCILPKKWLHTLDAFITQNNPEMVVSPVNYKVKDNSLEQFQLLDFMSLQGTTIGGFGMQFPFLCNGANLAYKKEKFLQLNGFSGNDNIASGDDIFLFEKFIEADKKSVLFLKSKDATVTTFPVNTNTDLINQRVRWASKTSKFKSAKVKLIGILIFLVNLSIILSLFFAKNLVLMLLPLTVKITVDLFLLIPTMRFYNHKNALIKWYFFSSLLYPFFSVYIVFKSLFYEYNWKGRNFKK